MSLRNANYQLEKLENKLNRLLKEKEVLESSVGIKAIDTSKIIVDGGKRVDRLLEYTISKELKELDTEIQITQNKIKNWMNYIDEELKIMKKYDKVLELIVYYKEDKKCTWYGIASKVHLSIRQCQRIYKKYVGRRDIHE